VDVIARCLQHAPFEGPAGFEPILQSAGYHIDCRVVPAEGLPPDPGAFLLVMGGPMSVNDPDPWIQEEITFIRRALDQDLPVLGICLGSQLLARAVGGTVGPGPRFEMGVMDVTRTAAGASDPIFSGFGDRFPVFQWHGEGVQVPPSCEVLAESADYPVQAFRAADRAYGTLFHLEVTEESMEALCRHCPEDIQRADTDADSIRRAARPRIPELYRHASALLRGLLGRPA
jgi:GMP synthase-like glutamine amidotransferase